MGLPRPTTAVGTILGPVRSDRLIPVVALPSMVSSSGGGTTTPPPGVTYRTCPGRHYYPGGTPSRQTSTTSTGWTWEPEYYVPGRGGGFGSG